MWKGSQLHSSPCGASKRSVSRAKGLENDFQTWQEHKHWALSKTVNEGRLDRHIYDGFTLKFFCPWSELVTVIFTITSFSKKSGRLGVHESIIYTRYRKEKWQKERWVASRAGSFSSGSCLSSCEFSLLALLATSSASISFPAAISQGNSPNSLFLHLQDITFITRQCFFFHLTNIPGSSELEHNPSRLLQSCDSQIYEHCNLCLEKCRCSATPELVNKVCLRNDTSTKAWLSAAQQFLSKLVPLERIQMGWPTITYDSSKYQSSYMPCEGQIQSEDLYCSQVTLSRC